jgi:2-polyprenyl-3-methyl-5-hydroxy-6-metoxy-1,4-benzoquinol methylase
VSWLKERRREAEIQDQPDLDTRHLHAALVGLKRINFWSGTHKALWPALRALASEAEAPCLSVIDLATGAGDIPISLWRRARREGLDLEIAGCDVNPRTVAFAQELAAKKKAPVNYFTWDILRKDLPRRFDVVTCSLFLHHLDDEQAVRLLRRMARTAARMIVVSDLRRSVRGLILAYLGTRLLPTSSVNRVDSLRSVRAAFTLAEARRLADRAGLAEATLTTHWPCRFLLSWRRSPHDRVAQDAEEPEKRNLP